MSKSTKNILTSLLFFIVYLVLREFIGFEVVLLLVVAGIQADLVVGNNRFPGKES